MRQKHVWVRGHYRRVGRRRQSNSASWLILAALATGFMLWAFLTYPLIPIAVLLSAFLIFLLKIVLKRRKQGTVSPSQGCIKDRRYIPDALRQSVLTRDQYRCQACNSTSYLELDHIIPLSKGGATSYENLQVLCRQCNLQKGNR